MIISRGINCGIKHINWTQQRCSSLIFSCSYSVQLAENRNDALLLVVKATVTLWIFCVIAAVPTADGSNQSLRQTPRCHRGRQLHHNRTQTAGQFREEVLRAL